MTTVIPRKLAALSIVLVTLAAYLPSLRCGFIWDDNAHVTRPDLRSISGLSRIWFDPGATQQYYPLLHSAFWIEQKLWGEEAWAYHLINVLQHAGAACLVFLILKKLRVPGAYFAAILFAVHPVQVESVAWVTEQKNTLSALFYLGALWAYLFFDETRRWKFYGVATGLFFLGLLTKTVIATLPAALLVIFWWQRGTFSWRKDVVPLLPWFILGAAAGLTTTWVERNLIGAEGAMHELDFLQRCLLAGRVIWFYIAKLAWPTNLLFIYPRWNIDPAIWWQWLYPAAALAATIVLWLFHRHSRGPLACWLFFIGTLFPVLGFLNVFPFIYSFVANHFQYLACLGMIVLFSASTATLFSKWNSTGRRVGTILGAVLVASCAVLDWQQIQTYADNTTLFEHTLQGNPDCWMADNNLGYELLLKGDANNAVAHFRHSLDINPDNPAALANMGLAAEQQGDMPEAIRWYQSAIDHNSDYFLAHNNLGRALMLSGHPEQAIQHYAEAIRLRPGFAAPHFNLATALAQLGHNAEAITQYETALQLQPDYPDAHHNLGFLLAAAGKVEQAVAHYREALRQRPNFPEAHFNWANAVAHDNPQEAIEHYQSAIRFRPDYAEAYANLASTYWQIGEHQSALAAMQKAVELAKSQNNGSLVEQLKPLLDSYQSK